MDERYIIPIEADPVLVKLEGQRAIIQTIQNYAEKIEGKDPNEYQDDIDYFDFKIESHIAHKRNKKIKLIMNESMG